MNHMRIQKRLPNQIKPHQMVFPGFGFLKTWSHAVGRSMQNLYAHPNSHRNQEVRSALGRF